MYIGSGKVCDNPFIITRRISDNKILKRYITYDDKCRPDNEEEIEDILSECADKQLYDVVISS